MGDPGLQSRLKGSFLQVARLDYLVGKPFAVPAQGEQCWFGSRVFWALLHRAV